MPELLQVDLPLTSAQLSEGHLAALTVTRRVSRGTRWELGVETLRLQVPAGVAPLTVLGLPGQGHEGPDGAGELQVRLVVEQTPMQELRLSTGDARRGARKVVVTATGHRFTLDVPALCEHGTRILSNGWLLRVIVDGLLTEDEPGRRPARAGKWIRSAGLLLAVYGLVAAFALPFSDLSAPVVSIGARFFVLGIVGLAVAVFGADLGAVRGPKKGLVLAGALLAFGAATVSLLQLLERLGVFSRVP